MAEPLSAAEVAERLGVALPTVYAYASRGSLTRRPGPDGRRSLYDADEVELLVRRGRPRTVRRRAGAVDVVVGTTVSEIGDGWIRLRGRELTGPGGLSGRLGAEEVAELLWTGEEPDGPVRPAVPTELRRAVTAAADALPDGAPALSRLLTGTAVAAADPAVDRTGDGGHRLVDALVTALAPHDPSRPDEGRLATRLWRRFSPLAPTPARVRALELALVLLAEHELATSALAARVAASTGASPAACVAAGLGAVSGPLHGQAAVRVHRRLLARAAGQDVAAGPDGFGHLVHRHGDPRAAPLHDAVAAIASPTHRDVVALDLADAAAAGMPPPNVDAALGALALVARAEPGATEAVFAVARTPGWLAHAHEEADELPLRYRGRTLYRGATPRPTR